jgi:hypothetical protein
MAVFGSKPKPALTAAQRLEDWIATLDRHLDAYQSIEDEIIATHSAPGVPIGVTRQVLLGRAGHCRCEAARLLLELGKSQSRAA